jgi:predicted nuclease of predicted toxin-antitoxin system
MKLCVDENVRRTVPTILQQEGYDVVRVQDALELGDNDERIVEFCREGGRIILTNDDDFFEFNSHPGVFFLDEQRASPRTVVTAIQRIERLVPDLTDQVWHVPDGWV